MTTKTTKMFCKICFDTGKSEEEFTSHFVKDAPPSAANNWRGGAVVCPVLLATECRYCHDLGHTKNHCEKLKAKIERAKHRQTPKRRGERALGEWLSQLAPGARVASSRRAVPTRRLRVQPVSTSNSFAALATSRAKNAPHQRRRGPKRVAPRAAQGAWASAPAAPATTWRPVDMRCLLTPEEQAFLDQHIDRTSLTMGQQAELEAFADSVQNAEDAAVERADTERFAEQKSVPSRPGAAAAVVGAVGVGPVLRACLAQAAMSIDEAVKRLEAGDADAACGVALPAECDFSGMGGGGDDGWAGADLGTPQHGVGGWGDDGWATD